MKKKNTVLRLRLEKKTIIRLIAPDEQRAIAGGLTQYTTCCTSNPLQKETTCCSLASCGSKDIC